MALLYVIFTEAFIREAATAIHLNKNQTCRRNVLPLFHKLV